MMKQAASSEAALLRLLRYGRRKELQVSATPTAPCSTKPPPCILRFPGASDNFLSAANLPVVNTV